MDLPSWRALILIDRLHHYWRINADVDPPIVHSAVHSWFERWEEPADDTQLIDISEIIAGGGEYRRATG